MTTSFQHEVTLPFLRESAKNILPYTGGECFTDFMFKNSTRKQENYQGIQHEIICFGKIGLCNHYLSRKLQKIKCTFRIS